MKDEGGPLGIGFQEQVSNHSKLLRRAQCEEIRMLRCASSKGWCVQQEVNLPGQESEAP